MLALPAPGFAFSPSKTAPLPAFLEPSKSIMLNLAPSPNFSFSVPGISSAPQLRIDKTLLAHQAAQAKLPMTSTQIDAMIETVIKTYRLSQASSDREKWLFYNLKKFVNDIPYKGHIFINKESGQVRLYLKNFMKNETVVSPNRTTKTLSLKERKIASIGTQKDYAPCVQWVFSTSLLPNIQTVARKRILANSNEKARQACITEAQLGENFDHSNLCSVFNWAQYTGKEGVRKIIIYEKHFETDLSKLTLPSNSELKKPLILNICKQLLAALSSLHSQRLIHRDLKPENTFVSYIPESNQISVGLGDYGLSASAESKIYDRTAGTAHYFSPEHFGYSSFFGTPVDMWALGLMLWKLYYGKAPTWNVATMVAGRSAWFLQIFKQIIDTKPIIDSSSVPETFLSEVKELTTAIKEFISLFEATPNLFSSQSSPTDSHNTSLNNFIMRLNKFFKDYKEITQHKSTHSAVLALNDNLKEFHKALLKQLPYIWEDLLKQASIQTGNVLEDLIRKMLHPNPLQRITADQALEKLGDRQQAPTALRSPLREIISYSNEQGSPASQKSTQVQQYVPTPQKNYAASPARPAAFVTATVGRKRKLIL